MNVLSKAMIIALFSLTSSPTALGQPVATFGDVPENYWAYSFIEELAALGITNGCGGGNFCPDASVTRAQMAVFMVRAIDTVLEHHAFVSVPGHSVHARGETVPAYYYLDGSVYAAQPGNFAGVAAVQLPDQMRILGMTCSARNTNESFGVDYILLLRYPLAEPTNFSSAIEVILQLDGTSFGLEFGEATAGVINPNAATVDNANFVYMLEIRIADFDVTDPLVDSAGLRGCSIELSR